MASCSLLCAAAVGLLLCLAPTLLDLLLRREFAVHTSGAVLVTGCSSGIGKHACLGLAASHEGLTLYCGVRKEKDAQMLLQESGGRVKPVILDTTKEENILAVAKQLSEDKLVGLVNNAGVTLNCAIEFCDMADVRWLFDVNFFSTLRLVQVLAPQLRANQGRIVVISSVMSKAPGMMAVSAYSASKHAVDAAYDSLRQEMAPHGVSVSIVNPGMVQSDIGSNKPYLMSESFSDDNRRLYAHAYKVEPMFKKLMEEAPGPQVTTDAIDHALTSPYPKMHYMVADLFGIPSSVLEWVFWLLPKVLTDRANDFQ